jgi:hypothetical protein
MGKQEKKWPVAMQYLWKLNLAASYLKVWVFCG